jgi:hypothetical protein
MIVTAPASVFAWFQAAEAAHLAATTIMMAAVIVLPTTLTAIATIEMIAPPSQRLRQEAAQA